MYMCFSVDDYTFKCGIQYMRTAHFLHHPHTLLLVQSETSIMKRITVEAFGYWEILLI